MLEQCQPKRYFKKPDKTDQQHKNIQDTGATLQGKTDKGICSVALWNRDC
jgi:hypothetical protein